MRRSSLKPLIGLILIFESYETCLNGDLLRARKTFGDSDADVNANICVDGIVGLRMRSVMVITFLSLRLSARHRCGFKLQKHSLFCARACEGANLRGTGHTSV